MRTIRKNEKLKNNHSEEEVLNLGHAYVDKEGQRRNRLSLQSQGTENWLPIIFQRAILQGQANSAKTV